MFTFYQLSSTAIFTGCVAFTINAAVRIRPIVPLHVGGGVLLTLDLTGTPTGLSGITLSDSSAGNLHDLIATDLCE